MPDLKISQLPNKPTIASSDLLVLVDETVSPVVSKQVTVSELDARTIALAIALG